jgi:hypothetical protein
MARRTLIQQSRVKSSKDKARFHEETGTGRRRVRRPFFSLNASDENAVVDQVNKGLERLLQEHR